MAVAEATLEAIKPPATSEQTEVDEVPQAYSQQEFESFASAYPDLRTELTAEGKLIIMPPAGGDSGRRNSKIATRLGFWSETDDTGETFDSSTGFILPNGANHSPDAAWIERSRWEALSPEQKRKFPPLCPDFVVELRSASDRLSDVQKKMREYLDNGVKLGWLIDPISHRVEVYRPKHEVEVLDAPTSVSGEPLLPGFTLNLKGILE